MMELVLSPEEQKQARKAAMTNDRQTLRQLAAVTMERLCDPKHNKDLIEGLESTPGVSVFAHNGTTVVNIPGHGTFPLRTLIRDGKVKYPR